MSKKFYWDSTGTIDATVHSGTTTGTTYNYLEVSDIVNFSNWDANLKIFGDTISTADGYMITQITKFPNKAKIVLTEVAGNIA